MSKQMIILSGIPGSGKSTYAFGILGKDPEGWVRINYDDLRREMFGKAWLFNGSDEQLMKAEARMRCVAAMNKGLNVIIDNTNLTEKVRQGWIDIAKALDYQVVLEDLDVPIAECVRRDGLRPPAQSVGRAVIEWMALTKGYIDWSDKAVYPRDFVIIDMDGTLADCTKRRQKAALPSKHRLEDHSTPTPSTEVLSSPCPTCKVRPKMNWDIFYEGCDLDPAIEPIRRLAFLLSRNYDILIVSGRPIDKAGKGTETWIRRYLSLGEGENIVKHLFMRPSGDSRPDYVVKQEILDLLPKERIILALDDRDQVVKMWRKNGLTCLQVAEGDF